MKADFRDDRVGSQLGEPGVPGGGARHVAGVSPLQRQAGDQLVDAGGADAALVDRVSARRSRRLPISLGRLSPRQSTRNTASPCTAGRASRTADCTSGLVTFDADPALIISLGYQNNLRQGINCRPHLPRVANN